MPKLKWMQSTFAGCNQMLDQTRRDFTVTRVAGFFGPDMAEYAAGQILALEREFAGHSVRQSRAEWLGAREGGGSYRRLPSLTLGILGYGNIGSQIARALKLGFGMRVIGCRRRPVDAEEAKVGLPHSSRCARLRTPLHASAPHERCCTRSPQES